MGFTEVSPLDWCRLSFLSSRVVLEWQWFCFSAADVYWAAKFSLHWLNTFCIHLCTCIQHFTIYTITNISFLVDVPFLLLFLRGLFYWICFFSFSGSPWPINSDLISNFLVVSEVFVQREGKKLSGGITKEKKITVWALNDNVYTMLHYGHANVINVV